MELEQEKKDVVEQPKTQPEVDLSKYVLKDDFDKISQRLEQFEKQQRLTEEKIKENENKKNEPVKNDWLWRRK